MSSTNSLSSKSVQKEKESSHATSPPSSKPQHSPDGTDQTATRSISPTKHFQTFRFSPTGSTTVPFYLSYHAKNIQSSTTSGNRATRIPNWNKSTHGSFRHIFWVRNSSLLDSKTLSALATRLRHAGSKVISATNVSLAYDNTHETSPLRRFMVAVFLESSYDTNVGKTYHHEFIAELALVQAQRDLYTSFPFLPSPRPYPHPIDIICRFDHHGSEKKFGSCRGGLKTC